MSGASSGRSGKEDIVRAFPVGQQAVCYVDPADPASAVLLRRFTASMLIGLFPLLFVVIGLAVLLGLSFGGRSKWLTLAGTKDHLLRRTESGLIPAESRNTPVVLKPALSPIGKAAVGLLVVLFWNGIVGVFVFQFFSGWQRGRPEWFLGVFMIPFVLIGLGIMAWCGMMFLALANLRPRLTIEPGTPCPGGTLRLQHGFTGAVQRLERVVIELVDRESATYRRGTDTRTDKSVFSRILLLETTDRSAMRAGETELVLPNDVPRGSRPGTTRSNGSSACAARSPAGPTWTTNSPSRWSSPRRTVPQHHRTRADRS